MRIAAIAATLLFALASCSTTSNEASPYQQPNQLMATEIDHRVDQIPYQHRDELLENLLWLAQTGEQTIPALVNGLRHESPKVRSSCAWVLGRLRDRRTIGSLQSAMRDSEAGVRLEAARSLVLMGDLQQSPLLIEGLDSDRKEVRYLCHEALKTATGHDYGYDHLNQNTQELQVAVLRWRQWWGEYSGDQFFAKNYQQKHGLGAAALAAPGGETKPMPNREKPQAPDGSESTGGNPQPDVMPNPAKPQTSNPTPNKPSKQDSPDAGTQPVKTPVVTPAKPTSETVDTPNKPQAEGAMPPSAPAGETAKPTKPSDMPMPAAEPAKPAKPGKSINPKAQTSQKKPVVELPVIEIPAKAETKKPGGAL